MTFGMPSCAAAGNGYVRAVQSHAFLLFGEHVRALIRPRVSFPSPAANVRRAARGGREEHQGGVRKINIGIDLRMALTGAARAYTQRPRPEPFFFRPSPMRRKRHFDPTFRIML